MKSLAWNLLGNRQDAEEAVQETFLKAYRASGEFRGQAALNTWMFRILVNTCHNFGRAKRRRREAEPVADTGVSDGGLRFALRNAIEKLDEPLRRVFLLYEVEGFTHAEVGAILDIPEGTSKARLFEAKQHLRRLLR